MITYVYIALDDAGLRDTWLILRALALRRWLQWTSYNATEKFKSSLVIPNNLFSVPKLRSKPNKMAKHLHSFF